MNDSLSKALKIIIDSVVNNEYINNAIKSSQKAMNSVLEALNPIMEQIKDNSKILAEHSIELGFYPSNSFNLYESEFIRLKTRDQEIDYISDKVRELLTKEYINEINKYFKKEKLKNIYDDYLNKDYDSAILKLIVIINIIFNDKLVGISSEQLNEVKRVFNNIVTGAVLPEEKTRLSQKDIDWKSIEDIHSSNGFDKYAYYIFAPYYYTSKKSNPLFKNCNDNRKTHEEIKNEYKKIPYNRNAIIHGYVENYGTELNCLRWFSVLINTYELFKLLEELSVSE